MLIISLCGSLQKIGDGILSFIEEQRYIIVNLLGGEDGVSLESALEHQCQSDVDTQEWLSTKMINYVISQARSQRLRFAHCYLYEKSSNTVTMCVSPEPKAPMPPLPNTSHDPQTAPAYKSVLTHRTHDDRDPYGL